MALHNVRRFGSLMCPLLAYSLHSIRADSLLPKELNFQLCPLCLNRLWHSVTSWLPQRQSFRGKRFTATWTFLFERLGRSSTPLTLYREYRSATLKNVFISAVKISRLLRRMVNLPTSINLAFIQPQIKDYGVGIPAELAKSVQGVRT